MRIWLYGRPFSGKTTFASKIPNAVILSTDGNATGLIKDENIIPIKSVPDLSKFMEDWKKGVYKGKDTIIVDVLEHIYDMIREYTLEKNKIEHESDGSWGKGWQLVKDAEWYTISKLARLADNVIFLSHEEEYTVKSSIGKETTCYRPAITEKLHDELTGLMSIVCRAFVTEVSLNGQVVKKYNISIGDTSTELSGIRAPYSKNIKSTKIENDYDIFMKNISE
jgi:hypothetical protein